MADNHRKHQVCVKNRTDSWILSKLFLSLECSMRKEKEDYHHDRE